MGEFEHAAYGVVTVARRDAGLAFEFHGIKMPLSHFHYDRFDTPDDEQDGKFSLNFRTNPMGEVESADISLDEAAVTFTRRVPAALTTDATLKMYAGTYSSPSGAKVEVAFQPGKGLSIRGAGGFDLQPWRPHQFRVKEFPDVGHLLHGRGRQSARDAAARSEREFAFPRQQEVPRAVVGDALMRLRPPRATPRFLRCRTPPPRAPRRCARRAGARGATSSGGVALILIGDPSVPKMPERRVLGFDHHLARASTCGSVEHLRVVADRPARDVVLLEQRTASACAAAVTVIASMRSGQRLHDACTRLALSANAARRWSTRDGPERRHRRRNSRSLAAPERDVAVGAADRLVRRVHPVRRAERRRDASAGEILGRLPHRQRDAGVDQRRVDLLAGRRCDDDARAPPECRRARTGRRRGR